MARPSSYSVGVRTRSSTQRDDNAASIPPMTGVIDLSLGQQNNQYSLNSMRPTRPFIRTLDTRTSLLSSSTGSPSPSSCSSSSPTYPDPDDAWNLVPYHVSWGHKYQEYRAGILPGPEGNCIFLRSPTPLKNQRTIEACKKCRERKAKCTGGRPACARCTARDYVCEYTSQVAVPASATDSRPSLERLNGVAKNRKRRGDAFTGWNTSNDTVHIADADEDRVPEPNSSLSSVPVKMEDSPLPSVPSLGYLDSPTHATNWEGSTPSDEYNSGEPWTLSYPQSPLRSGGRSGDVSPSSFFEYDMASLISDEQGSGNVVSIVAPQPVRRSSIIELEASGKAEAVGADGGQGCVDPMLTEEMYAQDSRAVGCESFEVDHGLGYGRVIPTYLETAEPAYAEGFIAHMHTSVHRAYHDLSLSSHFARHPGSSTYVSSA